jgi:hypothetical protein
MANSRNDLLRIIENLGIYFSKLKSYRINSNRAFTQKIYHTFTIFFFFFFFAGHICMSIIYIINMTFEIEKYMTSNLKVFPSIPYKTTLISKHASCQMVPLHRHCSLNHINQKRRFYTRIQEIS